jgi:hydroxypyruvate isomerase
VTEDEQHRTAWENLEFAAEQARAAGISVLVEPLNALDNPDYLLPDLASAADLVGRARQAGHPNVGILLDVYHLARTEKTQQDVEAAIGRYSPEVLHVQLADLPDRRCPGTGDLDFAGIQRALATSGYRGFLSLEFAGGPDPDKALREALDFIRP